ncbi:hypothetical protein L218DRAFT_957677 [Marasmius fiardii PR-910]|nr:hypothetical protein L218DRAFT_957677 [Marasmius fiardii PR-910]
MSNGSAPEFTIPTHFDNPTQPHPEFTPMPFDTECPTGIPLVFNKDDYPPLEGESWKDHRERLRKEKDRVDTESKRIKRVLQDFEDLKEEHEEQEEGRKAAYEADLENWEQEEELRQWKWADYIAHVQREVEERKREEQRRASAAADASTDTPVSAENPDDAESEEPMKLIADNPEEEGQKTRKGKGKERSVETESETEWVASKKRCVDCVKYDTTCHVLASGRARACTACKKHKSKCLNTGQPFDRVIVPPAKKKGSKSDKRLGPEEAEVSKSLKKRKRGDDDDEEYEGESEKE